MNFILTGFIIICLILILHIVHKTRLYFLKKTPTVSFESVFSSLGAGDIFLTIRNYTNIDVPRYSLHFREILLTTLLDSMENHAAMVVEDPNNNKYIFTNDAYKHMDVFSGNKKKGNSVAPMRSVNDLKSYFSDFPGLIFYYKCNIDVDKSKIIQAWGKLENEQKIKHINYDREWSKSIEIYFGLTNCGQLYKGETICTIAIGEILNIYGIIKDKCVNHFTIKDMKKIINS